jgi:hypothetical protein
MRAQLMPASRPFLCALASALTFACVEPENVAQPASPTQPLVEVRPSPQAGRKPGPSLAGGPSVATRYQDDWFGGVTLLGVDSQKARAVVRLEAHDPPRLAVDVIDLEKGVRVERWEATPERAKAAQGGSFAPISGSFETDANRFAALLRELGPWHMRPALATPTFAVSPRTKGPFLFGSTPTDGSQGDWLFAMQGTGAASRRIDQGLIASYSPVFAPDGENVVFRGCNSSPCDYGLFLVKVGEDRPRRVTGVQTVSPPAWTAGGEAVLTVGSRANERCLFKIGVSPLGLPKALACVKGLEDVSFSQDPDGRTAVLAGVRGRAGAQAVDITWTLVADGSVLGTHTIERAVGSSVISASGLLAMPMQKGAVGLVDLVTGKSSLVPSEHGWFFGFEGARWLGDRLVLLRKIEGKKGFEIVTVDARAMTERDKWM